MSISQLKKKTIDVEILKKTEKQDTRSAQRISENLNPNDFIYISDGRCNHSLRELFANIID